MSFSSNSVKILILLTVTFVIVSCKKKTNFGVAIPEPPVVILPPQQLPARVDVATPINSQPFVIGADKKPLTNVTTSMAPKGYQLDFSDEFNASTLNLTKWSIDDSPKSRNARPNVGVNDWFWKPSLVSVNGTDLVLKASKFDSNTMYCSAINSRGKYDQQYGFFETRIDNADIQKAVHTAFWLTGGTQGNVDGSGNDGCEVDVFESAYTSGGQTQTALHWDGYGDAAKGWTKHWANAGPFAADIHNGYHIFGFEWDATGMAFYYDGVKMFTYTGVGTPLVKEYILLSTGASFGDGDFTSRTVGELTDAKVDWIRVYTKK